MAVVYFSLGANIGDKRNNMITAVALLSERVGNILALSDLYETTPWGFVSENNFLNGKFPIIKKCFLENDGSKRFFWKLELKKPNEEDYIEQYIFSKYFIALFLFHINLLKYKIDKLKLTIY